MSLQEILKTKTEDSEWAHLFINKLNVKNIISPDGNLTLNTNDAFPVGFYSVLTGTAVSIGVTDNANIVSKTGGHYQISGNVRWLGITAPIVAAGLSRFIFHLSVPFDITYPSGPTSNLPCACVASIVETVGPAPTDFPSSSCKSRLSGPNVIEFVVDIQKDISGALAGRNLDVQYVIMVDTTPI